MPAGVVCERCRRFNKILCRCARLYRSDGQWRSQHYLQGRVYRLAVWDGNIISQTVGAENITNSDSASRFELCFETDELDNVYKALKDNNVRFLHEINTELWGQRTIRFYDPDGHLIEVGEEMSIFLKRIYEEEGCDLEATAKRTFMPLDTLKHFVEN
jgi:hypothetical protein